MPRLIPPLLMLLLLTGCAHPPPAATPPRRRIDAPCQVRLIMRPTPRQLDPVTFTIELRNRHNLPLNDAHVSLDLAMPSMAMPQNTLRMQAKGSGRYTAIGRFTMPGEWQVKVTAAAGKTTITQSFPVTVR